MSLISAGSISLDSAFNGQMHSKTHTALTAPLVLHHTRIYKRAMKNSSMVKGTMNAPRVCKLRNGVKNASISSFFNGQRWTKCAMNILRSYQN